MKKLLWLLPAAILALTACSKDDNNESDSKVTIGTETFDFDTTTSSIESYGDYYETGVSEDYEVTLRLSNGYVIFLDIVVPAGTTNPSHDYSLCTETEAEEGKVWAFVEDYSVYGDPDQNSDTDFFEFASGTLNVAYNTTTKVFTININGKLSDNRAVKGRYKGTLVDLDDEE